MFFTKDGYMTTLATLISDANHGLISIGADLTIGIGFDQISHEAGIVPPNEFEDYELMPPAERLALADRMIKLWQRYADAVTAQHEATR